MKTGINRGRTSCNGCERRRVEGGNINIARPGCNRLAHIGFSAEHHRHRPFLRQGRHQTRTLMNHGQPVIQREMTGDDRCAILSQTVTHDRSRAQTKVHYALCQHVTAGKE